MTLHPLEVVGVRVELPANQPVVLLKEADGVRYLPIWIGAVEASAIAFEQQGVQTPRPMTHDLLKNVLFGLNVQVQKVVVNDLRDDTFYAVIWVEREGQKGILIGDYGSVSVVEYGQPGHCYWYISLVDLQMAIYDFLFLLARLSPCFRLPIASSLFQL